jgi:cysteine protease ATG4
MAGVDFGKYKRIVQYFWDPEPTNDSTSRSPIWCLGQQYKIPEQTPPSVLSNTPPQDGKPILAKPQAPAQAATPPDSTISTASSVDSALPYDESGSGGEDGGWPAAFLDDFEAKIWLTYRSNFPAIAKSQDPKALSSMSLSVRLRSQLVDQGGFTSDTGWGCMIRSGQSLLANSLLMLRMGRGRKLSGSYAHHRLTV